MRVDLGVYFLISGRGMGYLCKLLGVLCIIFHSEMNYDFIKEKPIKNKHISGSPRTLMLSHASSSNWLQSHAS
jgi:hypothetical protein